MKEAVKGRVREAAKLCEKNAYAAHMSAAHTLNSIGPMAFMGLEFKPVAVEGYEVRMEQDDEVAVLAIIPKDVVLSALGCSQEMFDGILAAKSKASKKEFWK